MADVARRAGVHAATVSRALRNDPRITAAQRERLVRLAGDMGYRPNPLVAALMRGRRSRRSPAYHATLAFITCYPASRAAYFRSEFGQLLAGAHARAHSQGYRIDEFNVQQPGYSAARVTEILHHRGIHGLIIAPLHSIHDVVELDWAQFAAVAVGYSFHGIPISRVSHHHFTGLSLAAQACRAAGRTRLGLLLPRRVHEKVERRWLAALLLEQAESDGGPAAPLLYDDWDELAFLRWCDTERPEVILCLDVPAVQAALARRSAAGPVPAIVSLDRRPRDRGVAGIDQDYPQVGAAAVDTVVGMLQRNERGFPAKPFNLLIDGTWIDGRTLPSPARRRRRAAAPARP